MIGSRKPKRHVSYGYGVCECRRGAALRHHTPLRKIGPHPLLEIPLILKRALNPCHRLAFFEQYQRRQPTDPEPRGDGRVLLRIQLDCLHAHSLETSSALREQGGHVLLGSRRREIQSVAPLVGRRPKRRGPSNDRQQHDTYLARTTPRRVCVQEYGVILAQHVVEGRKLALGCLANETFLEPSMIIMNLGFCTRHRPRPMTQPRLTIQQRMTCRGRRDRVI